MAFVQKQMSLNRELCVAFIDFDKAFDYINRNILWISTLKFKSKDPEVQGSIPAPGGKE